MQKVVEDGKKQKAVKLDGCKVQKTRETLKTDQSEPNEHL